MQTTNQQNSMNNGIFATNAALKGQNTPLTEEEMAYNLLYDQKALMDCTTKAIEESSTAELRKILLDCFQMLEKDQMSLFSIMQQQGYYKIKPVNQQDLTEAQQKFAQLSSTL